jgi:hypothetical protein
MVIDYSGTSSIGTKKKASLALLALSPNAFFSSGCMCKRGESCRDYALNTQCSATLGQCRRLQHCEQHRKHFYSFQ